MKKILSTLLTLVACVSLLHAATPFVGNPNLEWAYDNHVLTISIVNPAGDRAIPDFTTTPDNLAPWYNTERNNITSIELPEGLTRIGDAVFYQCKKLRSVTIPASVTSLGDGAFRRCEALESVTAEGVETIGISAFYQCFKLTSVTMPNVTAIERGAFGDCTSLISIVIPNGVTEIAQDLFNGCTNLKSVTLPNCTKIFNRVFQGCSSLRRIIYNGETVPTTYGETFDGVPVGGMFFVPNETAKTAFGNPWNGFKVSSLAPKNDFNEEGTTIPEDKTATMTALKDDGAIVDIKFTGRSFLRDGCYNTLCLPFDLSAEQLADEANPLNNFSIYEITGLAYVGSLIKFEINKVSEMEAGKPYLVKYNADPDAEPLAPYANPEFTYVQVTADAGSNTAVTDVAMKGILKPTVIEANENTMFLLSGNRLAWVDPLSAATMKGFRAYFVFNDAIPAAPLRRMSACIVENNDETPTAIEFVEKDDKQVTKVIENGTIYIIKNGVKYNVQGQVISK